MKTLFVLVGVTLISNVVFAQESQVFDSLTFKSNILRKEKAFALYLPKGYESSQRRYPVLYLLHGGSGNQRDWIQKGEVQRIADKAIEDGKAAPMIIVMPDAEMTFYMNNVSGKYQFEDFFMQELIPYIEKKYRCLSEKRYRAISGLSMGGCGSLLYAIHHPDSFSACAAMSPGIWTDEQIVEMPHKEYLRRFRSAMGELKEGEPRISEFWNQNSILFLVKQMKDEQKKMVRIYIDIGDDDFLYKANSVLHVSMRDLNIPHEFRIRDGSHDWEYWRSGLPDVLAFASESFR